MIPIFQRVTPDRFRLLVAESTSIKGLADMLGLSESAVSHGIHEAERNPDRKSVYQIMWVDADDLKEWKDIPGYKIRYRISEDAEIQYFFQGAWKKITTTFDKKRGLRVRLLRKDGTRRFIGVNTLMADAFMGGRKPGYVVIHADGMRTNCKLENLMQVKKRGGATGDAFKTRRKPVEMVNTRGEVLAVYGSGKEAAKANGLEPSYVCRRCRGEIRDKYDSHGITFQYIEEQD